MSRILLIDGVPFHRSLFAEDLEDAGHQVMAAANGASGLALLQRHTPTLVVTDVDLPDMDGTDLLSRLRRAFHNLPVIVHAAYSEMPERLRPADIDAYVVKSSNPNRLLGAVDWVLSITHAVKPVHRWQPVMDRPSNRTPPTWVESMRA
jgi:CheY-like chemotaxis protein